MMQNKITAYLMKNEKEELGITAFIFGHCIEETRQNHTKRHIVIKFIFNDFCVQIKTYKKNIKAMIIYANLTK